MSEKDHLASEFRRIAERFEKLEQAPIPLRLLHYDDSEAGKRVASLHQKPTCFKFHFVSVYRISFDPPITRIVTTNGGREGRDTDRDIMELFWIACSAAGQLVVELEHAMPGLLARLGVQPATFQIRDDYGLQPRETNRLRWLWSLFEIGWSAPASSELSETKRWLIFQDGRSSIQIPYSLSALRNADLPPPIRDAIPGDWYTALPQAYMSSIVNAATTSAETCRWIAEAITNQSISEANDRNADTTNRDLLALMKVWIPDGDDGGKLTQARRILSNTNLTANEKLTEIHALIPIPPTTSAAQLGKVLGVKKQAILKTDWWKQNRKGERASQIGRRRDVHQARSKDYEP